MLPATQLINKSLSYFKSSSRTGRIFFSPHSQLETEGYQSYLLDKGFLHESTPDCVMVGKLLHQGIIYTIANTHSHPHPPFFPLFPSVLVSTLRGRAKAPHKNRWVQGSKAPTVLVYAFPFHHVNCVALHQPFAIHCGAMHLLSPDGGLELD